MECMKSTMLGETAYTLKQIETNECIDISLLRRDIKKGLLKTSGKSFGAYYVVQSELDKYLNILKKL